MNLTSDRLKHEASATGFEQEPLEKALRLIALLDGLSSHPFLKPRFALKGGTALNFYHFDLPRLSVDIDLNYIGAPDRETMILERPRLERAIQAVCSREGLSVARVPVEHAGGKWRLTYVASHGGPDHLELDVNFLLRTPLWPCVLLQSRELGSARGPATSVLDMHELAAGKMAALLVRSASRDIFDVRALLSASTLDPARLRLAFVVYGGMNRKDWRTVSTADVRAEANEVKTTLLPMLRRDLAPARQLIASWVDRLVTECRERLAVVLPTASDPWFLSVRDSTGRL